MENRDADAPHCHQRESASSTEHSAEARLRAVPTLPSHTPSSRHHEGKNHHRRPPESVGSTDRSSTTRNLAWPSQEARSPGVLTPTRHIPPSGRRERMKQAKMFQAAYAAFALLVFCTLAGWLLYNLVTTTKGAKEMSRFCCPNILRELYEVMNKSKNPCDDFYHYTCYAWRENRSSAVYQRLTEDVVRPIFQLETLHEKGNPSASHPSTKIIGRYYRSCIEYALKGLKYAVNNSVLAIIETLKGIGPRSSGSVMLGGLLLLSAEYYLSTVVDFIYFPEKGVSFPDLEMVLSDEYYGDPFPTDEVGAAVEVFNAHYGTVVSAAAVMGLDQEIRRRKEVTRRRSLLRTKSALLKNSRWHTDIEALSRIVRVRPVVHQRISLGGHLDIRQDVGNDDTFELENLTLRDLGRAIPSVPQETWKDALVAGGYWHNDTQVLIFDRLAVTYALGVLTNSSRREVALALVVTMAASSLGLGLWQGLRGGQEMPSKLCENITNDLSPLWDVALTHVLTTPEKDATVRGIYADIVGTIKRAAVHILDPSDETEFNSLWSTFRLLLPSDRNPRHFNVTLNISETATHPEYNLAISHYWVFYDRFQEANKYPYELSLDRNVYNTTVVMTDNYVFVPPAVYALLNFASGTDRFINMAVIGVRIADVVWTALVRHSVWSNASRTKINKLKCSSDSGVQPFEFPWLSLWTAVETSMGSTWRSLMDGWGLWEVSRSQTFHMMVFYHHMCRSTVNRTTAERLSRFMRTVPDFIAAFNCSKANRTIPCLDSRERILSP